MKAVLRYRSANDTAQILGNRVWLSAVFLVVAIVIVAPLAIIDTPLLSDYPNHVARMHILGNVDNDILLAERYASEVDFIPNIAMDIAVPWLARGLPLDVAARLFLGACVVLTLASVAFLHRTLFNYWSPFSLIAALFVYHGSMIAGMANFSLAIGLVPAALAFWIRLQHADAITRLLAGSLMALVLFFCHLVAFGAYGLLIIGHLITFARDRWRRADRLLEIGREVAIAGTTGLLPLLLFLRLHLWSSGDATSFDVIYGNLAWKLKALLSPLANYNLPLDLASLALIAGLAVISFQRQCLRVDRRMVPGLLLLALAFALAPKALGNGGVFDQRLAILLALMLVACSRFDDRDSLFSRAAPTLLTLLFLARMAILTSTWIDHRDDLAEMRRAIDLMPAGARILVAIPDETAGQRLAPPRHRVFHHAVQLTSLPALAVVEKSAFVSTLYALPGQQPLTLKPPFDRLGGLGHVDLPTLNDLASAYRADGVDPRIKPQIQDWASDFDYVLMIYGYGQGQDLPIENLPIQPLLDGDILDLFQIMRVR